MKIIINADDFGKNKIVNQEIIKAAIAGHISSTSIMANGPCFDEAACFAQEYHNISFGIHLNLTEGFPISCNTSIFKKYGMIDETGRFCQKLKRYDTEELKQAIYEEWYEQIQKMKNLGVAISHIDGHHHIHVQMELQDVIIRLMKDFSIRKLRSKESVSFRVTFAKHIVPLLRKDRKDENEENKKVVRSVFPSYSVKSFLRSYYETVQWRKQCKKNDLVLTDFFYSYKHFIELYIKLPFVFRSKTIELMCHPGNEEYKKEMDLLCSETIKNLAPNVELISYKELKNR